MKLHVTRVIFSYRVIIVIPIVAILAIAIFHPFGSPVTKAASHTVSPSGNLPVPWWWYQNYPSNPDPNSCDQYHHPGSYPLPKQNGGFRGVIACGPRPAPPPVGDNASDVAVHFTNASGTTVGYGQLEWECAELVQRFMYLAYGVTPYQADASQIVSAFTQTNILQVEHNDGTAPIGPQAGDILSYGTPGEASGGHASIVVNSVMDLNHIYHLTILQQNSTNALDASTHTYNPKTRKVSATGYEAINGWLHYPGTPVNPSGGGTTPSPSMETTLYLAGDDNTCMAHYVYAINTSNGKIKWQYQTGVNVNSTPAIINGIVYIGSRDDNLYALHAVDGSLIWSFNTGAFVDSSPAVTNSIVYISAGTNLFALNATNGSLIWQDSVGLVPSWSSPAIANGKVYLGLNDGTVIETDATTGQLLWTSSYLGASAGTPIVDGGVAYVPTFTSGVVALNANNGSIIWHNTSVTGIQEALAPALDNDLLFVGLTYGATGGSVVALHISDGSIAWKTTADGYIGAAPRVSNGIVYAGSTHGTLYALRESDGSSLWSLPIQPGGFEASPALGNGAVYMTHSTGYVYSLNNSNGGTNWKILISQCYDSTSSPILGP